MRRRSDRHDPWIEERRRLKKNEEGEGLVHPIRIDLGSWIEERRRSKKDDD